MKVWNPGIELDDSGKNSYKISDEEIRKRAENNYKSTVKENKIDNAREARSIEAASKFRIR